MIVFYHQLWFSISRILILRVTCTFWLYMLPFCFTVLLHTMSSHHIWFRIVLSALTSEQCYLTLYSFQGTLSANWQLTIENWQCFMSSSRVKSQPRIYYYTVTTLSCPPVFFTISKTKLKGWQANLWWALKAEQCMRTSVLKEPLWYAKLALHNRPGS